MYVLVCDAKTDLNIKITCDFDFIRSKAIKKNNCMCCYMNLRNHYNTNLQVCFHKIKHQADVGFVSKGIQQLEIYST